MHGHMNLKKGLGLHYFENIFHVTVPYIFRLIIKLLLSDVSIFSVTSPRSSEFSICILHS